MKKLLIILILISFSHFVFAGTLFVGLESSDPPTFSSDLIGFPNISWTQNFNFNVSGAAARPDGTVYICEGAFTTHLYETALCSSPQQLCTISEDMSGLAFGRDTLWGYSNYADPKGIYSIDPSTGDATLELDVYSGTGYRFFALGYNPVDDLFYGYTEYGESGLYSINIDTGEMIHIVETIPASNGQGRGMAVGNNTVYLTATRGDDGIPFYAYDLNQGNGGDWIEFPNPYPDYHSTGGATWIPDPIEVGEDPHQPGLENIYPNPFHAQTRISFYLPNSAQVNLAVYNIKGQKVITLINEECERGSHSLDWHGEDSQNRKVESGVYFYKMLVNGELESIEKCVFLK